MSHWRFWRNTFASKRPCSILIGRSGRGCPPHGCGCSGQSRKVPHSGQGAAMTYAVHCVGRCSALRRPMQCPAMADAPRCDILPGTYLCVRHCQEPGCTAASRSAMSASHLQVQRCQEALHLYFRMSVEPPRGSTCQRRAMRSRPASMRSMMKSRMVKPHSEEPP